MENNNIDTIIGVNVILKGSLKNKGSIQINGTVEGEVRSDENIIVGESAIIKGPVTAKVVEVAGEVRGTIEAGDKLEVNPTGKIVGDINAKSLIIKQGAIFVGQSIMPGNTSSATATATTEKEKSEPKTEIVDKAGFFKK